MSAPARGWVALENVVTRDWVALQAMPAMGQTPVEYVRADIHETAVDELKAAMDELRRLRDVVGDVDRESIDSALSAAGEVVA